MFQLSVRDETKRGWKRFSKVTSKTRKVRPLLIWVLILAATIWVSSETTLRLVEHVYSTFRSHSKAQRHVDIECASHLNENLKHGQNIIYDNPIEYVEKKVPKGICRFDHPWRIPTLVKSVSPTESNNRFLYSPLKDVYINGLGHNLATINGEVWTALRLNLTYTHRISWYSVHSIPFDSMLHRFHSTVDELYRPFLHSGSVEQLFGWGVGEIPREHVQNSICPPSVLSGRKGICRICTEKEFTERKALLKNQLKHEPGTSGYSIKVDYVVELPYNLSFGFPFKPTVTDLNYAASFMSKHSHPNTVFTLPPHHCATNPVFGPFSRRQKAYFFHKYWSAHGLGAPSADLGLEENDTFNHFKRKRISSFQIAPFGRRPTLKRLNRKCIVIAVHARRGDFFKAKRPMVSIATIARIIRQIMKRVVEPTGGPFSELSVCVNIYSEGVPLNSSLKISLDHDVAKLGRQFMDSDGSLLTRNQIRSNFFDNNSDNLHNVFRNGLEVNSRISDNTILSIHEMIAADIFIGSESGLSANVVGSPSRAAFIIIPGKQNLGQSNADIDRGMFIRFDYNTTNLSPSQIETMKALWKKFQDYNQDSI